MQTKTNHPRHSHPAIDPESAKGIAVYTNSVLWMYNLFVIGFSSSFAWKCPSRFIQELYDQHVSNKHLDVGVGTGYFLDHCRFPTTTPAVSLLDLNPNCLQITAR